MITTAKEECAGILAGLAEIIQLCEEPKAREALVQAQVLLQDAIAIRMGQTICHVGICDNIANL